MSHKKDQSGMYRRTFIKMSSGAILAVSANWFLPHICLGEEDEIRIGGVCELTGPGSTTGVDLSRGMELAVEMYNKKGGVLGKKIKLILEDSECKKDVGLAKARRLVERSKVHFLSGVIFSTISMAIQAYARERKVLFVNSGSGNDDLIRPPYCDRYFFKIYVSTRLTCTAIQEPAKRLGRNWYFIGDDFSWGKGCVEYFKKCLGLVKPDFKVVGEDYPPFGETNYAPYITKVMAAKPDGLAVATYGVGWSRVIKHAREMGLKCHIHHQYWSLSDARATGDAIVGVTTGSDFLNENPQIPRTKIFSEAFKEKFGDYPGTHGATGFNGIESIIEAVKAAGTIDTEAVIDTMERITYKDSIQGGTYHFRKGDHQPITGIYTVEIIKDPKYIYNTKVLTYNPNPTMIMIPEGETGCGEYMKKKI